MPAANTRAMTMPVCPPSRLPNMRRTPVRAPRRIAVFRVFTGTSLVHVHFDLLGLRVLALGKMHFEHALPVPREDAVLVDAPGKLERSREGPVGSLDAMVILLLRLPDEFPLTAQGQRAVLDTQVDVLLLDPG